MAAHRSAWSKFTRLGWVRTASRAFCGAFAHYGNAVFFEFDEDALGISRNDMATQVIVSLMRQLKESRPAEAAVQ